MKKDNIIVENYTASKIILRDVFRAADFFQKLTKTKINSLSVSFVKDDEMISVNQKHLSHKGSTDVITFDYAETPDIKSVDGEIIICVDEAKRQSKIYNVTLSDELNRLLFHGLLHLTGYDDKNPGKSKAMKTKEDEVLLLWNQFNLNISK